MFTSSKNLHALLSGLALTGALALAAPSEVQACSPAPATANINYATTDGMTVTRTPSFLFDTSNQNNPTAQDFTLLDSAGAPFEVVLEQQAGVLFGAWYVVSAKNPLPAGSYTLTYEVDDPYSPQPAPGSPPPTYTKALQFTVDAAVEHPGALELGLEWTRLRNTTGLIWEDSCGGSNAEQNELALSFGAACRTPDFDVQYAVDFIDESGSVLYSYVRTVPASDLSSPSADGLITSTFRSSSQGFKSFAECVRVTPFTTTGVRGDTIELCEPTLCGEGADFNDETVQLQDCPNAGSEATSIPITTPYPASACMLSTGFDPCEGVVCEANQQCDLGQCVDVDPCAEVVCEENQQCNAQGLCEDIDLCAGVTCEGNQTCEAGACVDIDLCADVVCDVGSSCEEGTCTVDEVDACAGITCASGESCEEGVCVAQEVDACADITCAATEICYEGKCYAEVMPGNNATPVTPTPGGSNNNTPEPPTSGGTDSSGAEDDGCQVAAGGASPAGTPWMVLGLLGLAGALRRRKR